MVGSTFKEVSDAGVGPDPLCKKCNGTGIYKYDWNHSTICDVCCPHTKGSWQLTEAFGKATIDMWCCLRGCGYTQKDKF